MFTIRGEFRDEHRHAPCVGCNGIFPNMFGQGKVFQEIKFICVAVVDNDPVKTGWGKEHEQDSSELYFNGCLLQSLTH